MTLVSEILARETSVKEMLVNGMAAGEVTRRITIAGLPVAVDTTRTRAPSRPQSAVSIAMTMMSVGKARMNAATEYLLTTSN